MKIKDNQFRSDIENYFKSSGIREAKKLNHTPFVVLNGDTIELCRCADELVKYPSNTQVLGQWRGQWSSDFFTFTVGDFLKYIAENPAESYHVI